MVIDQQEKIRDGSVRDTWTLFSYARPVQLIKVKKGSEKKQGTDAR